MKKIFCLTVLGFFLFFMPQAFAACADPVGIGGDIIFNNDEAQMQYCNDTDWIGFPKTDKVPDTFDFTDLTNQTVTTLVTSNIVTITGIDAPTNVTISGDGTPQYRINGGAWGTTGQISNGQTLQLRLTSGSAGTMHTALVMVGGSSQVAWNVSTVGADTTPNAFTFVDVTDANTTTLTTASAVTITGINSPANVTVTGSGSPQISINGGAWVTSGSISNNQTLRVRLTSSSSSNTTLTATVTVGGVSDAWTVRTNGLENFTFVASGKGNSQTITIPGPVTAGDLCIIWNQGYNGGTPADVTPSGFTKLMTATLLGSRMSLFAKILTGSETTVTGLDGDSSVDRHWAVATFHPDFPISGFSNGMTPNSEITNGNPAAQTITAASSPSKPIIVWGQMNTSGSVNPRTTSPVMNELTTMDAQHYAHYKIYSSSDTLVNHTYDMDDEGNANMLQSGYLVFTTP